MTIQELKQSILDNTYDSAFLIIKYSDFNTIPLEYAHAIAHNKNMKLKYIDDLNDSLCYYSIFGDIDTESSLNIIVCDSFDLSNYHISTEALKAIKSDVHPTIVICSKVSTSSLDKYTVTMPKVESWQVIDYMKKVCPDVNSKKLQWLYDISKGNLYRIENELAKLSMFKGKEQDKMFDMINEDNGYDDMTNMSTFNLTNNIIENNKECVMNILKSINSMETSSYGIVTLLYNDIRALISIKSSPKASSQSLGINQYKFNILSKQLVNDNANIYSMHNLIKAFDFLVDYDYELKSGNLLMSEDMLIEYVICNVMSILNN